MSFEDEIKQALERGAKKSQQVRAEQKAAALSQDELRRRHSEYRLTLSEYIENNLKRVPHLVPGFSFETVYGSRGWGGAISRDDLQRGGPAYSRLEISVPPAGEFNLLVVVGRGTIKNREVLNWNHFAEIADVNIEAFKQEIDSWILQFVEMFSAAH